MVRELCIRDGQSKVFADLVLIEHSTELQTDRGLPVQRPACDALADLLKLKRSRLEEGLALVRSHLRKLRITAGNEPLARIGGGRDLKEIALIEEAQLQRTGLNERADLATLQGRDPGHALDALDLADRFVRDHAAISHQHHTLKSKGLLELCDLRHQGLRIPRITLVHRHRDRATLPGGQKAVVHLQLVLLAVAVVADASQRTVRALEVARGEVIERQRPFAQVPRGKLALDDALSLEKPVHRRIQIILIGICHAEHLGERTRVPPARGRKLRVRSKHTCGNECANAFSFR